MGSQFVLSSGGAYFSSSPSPLSASAAAWQPVEVGVQQICYLLSQSVKPGANQAEVLSQLDQCRAFPDFNNYLAFIFSRGGGGSGNGMEANGGGGFGEQQLDLRLAAGLLLKNNLRSSLLAAPSSCSSPSSQSPVQQPGGGGGSGGNAYVRAALLELLFPTTDAAAPSPFAVAAPLPPPPPPLPRALRSAAAAAAAAIVGGGSSESGSAGGGGLGDWPELLEAMVSALEGRGRSGGGGGSGAAAAVSALEALVAVAEDSPLALSAPLPRHVAASLIAAGGGGGGAQLPAAAVDTLTPLDLLVPRLVSLCRPGLVADDDARCGAAEALNLLVAAGVGVASAQQQDPGDGLDLALPGAPAPLAPSPLAPCVAAALPRLAAALFDLLSDASCARGRRAGAAGLVQLVALEPGTLAVGPAAAALVAAFVRATGDADAGVALEAAELWPALADVAPDSPPLRDALPQLLPLLLRNMVYADDDDEVAEAEQAEAEALEAERERRRQRAASNGEASCSSTSQFGAHSHHHHVSHSLSAYAAHDPTRDSELAPFISRSRRANAGMTNGDGENGGENGGENDDASPSAAAAEGASTWNLRKASAAALDVLATTFGDELLPLVTPSIREGLAAVEEEEGGGEEAERRRRLQDAERRRRRAAKRRRGGKLGEEEEEENSHPSLPSTLDDDEDENDAGQGDSDADEGAADDDDPASGLAWRRREAAVLALGAIAEGCGPALAPHLPDLAALLLPCLAHARPLLRSIACWALSRYCRWLALAAAAAAGEASAASGGAGDSAGHPPPQPPPPQEGGADAASDLLDAVLSGLAAAAAGDPNPRVQEAACSGLATLVEEMGAGVAAARRRSWSCWSSNAGDNSSSSSRSNGGNGFPEDIEGGLWRRGCPACDAERARAAAVEAEAAARGGFGLSNDGGGDNRPFPLLLEPPLPPDQHLGAHPPPRLRVVSSALAAAARRYGRKPARMLYDAVATLADAAGPALGDEPAARAALVPALLERMRAMPDPGDMGSSCGFSGADRELLPLFECLTAAAAAMGPGFALSAGACLSRAASVLSAGVEARGRALREAAEGASRAFASAAASAAPAASSTNGTGGEDDRMFHDGGEGDGDDDGDLAAAAAAAASAAAAVLLPPSSSSSSSSAANNNNNPCLALSTSNEAAAVAAAVAAAASQGPERDFVVGALDLISGVVEGLGPAVSRFLLVPVADPSHASPLLSNGAAAAAAAAAPPPPAQPTRVGALLLPALLRAADDPDADVRQSAFALAGDLARSCPGLLAPAAADVVALATEGLSTARAGAPDAVSAANNAAWALGEVAVALPAAVAALAAAAAAAAAASGGSSCPSPPSPSPFSFPSSLPASRVLPTAADRLSALLCAPPGAAPRSLLENAAISLGRLSLVAPAALASGADARFVARWCQALRAVRDDVEKEHAFLGLAALLRANPAAGAPPAFASLCEAVTSWRLPLRSRALADELASLMRAYRAGAGPHAWGAAVAGLGPGVSERLAAMCGV